MRAVVFSLVVAVACSGPTRAPGEPVEFAVLAQGLNREACPDVPDFMLAIDDDSLIDLVDRQTACTGATEIEVPSVRLERRFVIGAWWPVPACPEAVVQVDAVERDLSVAGLIHVYGTWTRAECTPGEGAVESIVSVARGTGVDEVEFHLNGARVGSARR